LTVRGDVSTRRLVYVALAAAIVVFAACAVYVLWFPFAVDYGEGPLVDQARRLLAGESLYRAAWNRPPFVINNYPPLFPIAVAAASRALHVGLLAAGRLISILSTVASAVLIGRIARRAWDDRLAGWLAAALYLSNLFVVEWALVARVDSLALALSLAALHLLQTRAQSWRAIAAALLLMTASIYTRQTYALAVPFTAVLWLWSIDRIKTIAFTAALVTLNVSLFIAFNRATGGGFYFHTVLANENHFQWLRVLEFGARFVFASGIALGLALLARGAAPTDFARRALPAYAAASLAVALTVGKVGSWHNYFLELVAAVALLGAGAARVATRRFVRPLLYTQAVLAALVTAALLQWKLSVGWQNRAGYAAIAAEIARAPGPVLADDAMTMIVAADRPLYFQPFEYRQLQTTGRFDPSPLAREIAARRFALIVLRWPDTPRCAERWGPELLTAIKSHYRESIRAGALVSYVPAASDDPQRATNAPSL
jgi:4-amino-4-deoxy-L-arabinose transferase-like glycosyltransferase